MYRYTLAPLEASCPGPCQVPVVSLLAVLAVAYAVEVPVLEEHALGALQVETIYLGDRKLSVRTSVLEEKATACNMLCCYADELKEGFYPYVEQARPSYHALLPACAAAPPWLSCQAAAPNGMWLCGLTTDMCKQTHRVKWIARDLAWRNTAVRFSGLA